jgi:glucokinase
MVKNIISWDLGATKCAAAIVEHDELTKHYHCKKQFSLRLSTCQSLEELTDKLEHALGLRMSEVDAICIGAAGHYDGEKLQHVSGYPYSMHFAKIAQEYKWAPHAVIHDYAPVVCATFTSYMQQAQSVKRLNSSEINPGGRRVALGVGTGLGLKDGLLLSNGDFWLGHNETGHIGVSTPPFTYSHYHEQHDEFVRFLRSEEILDSDEALTFEKILSGKGIVRLYRFFFPESKEDTPEVIGKKMTSGQANEVRAMFAWYLGLFVGTVQLAYMPDGGIWITGGVILKHINIFGYPEFFHGIEASPAFLTKRQEFPLGILCNSDHAFMGGAYYAVNRLIEEI